MRFNILAYTYYILSTKLSLCKFYWAFDSSSYSSNMPSSSNETHCPISN